jgi:hypothetical protein
MTSVQWSLTWIYFIVYYIIFSSLILGLDVWLAIWRPSGCDLISHSGSSTLWRVFFLRESEGLKWAIKKRSLNPISPLSVTLFKNCRKRKAACVCAVEKVESTYPITNGKRNWLADP